MKYIAKGVEPTSFAKWHHENSGANWDDFSGTSEYQEVKNQLTNEQNSLCCYCEISIEGDSGTHIEHHKPKSNPRYRRDTFNYQNLFACCQYPDSCGHKKQGEYFPGLISPLSIDCQDRFTYTGNGKIIPKDEEDNFAYDTISLLGLNCKRLKNQRESILKNLDCPGMDKDYIIQALQSFRDWYKGFYTVIQYVAQKRNIQAEDNS